MTIISLTASNYCRFFAFNSKDQVLSKRDACRTLVMNIVLGVMTAGLFHLIARLALYERNFKVLVEEKANIARVRNAALNIASAPNVEPQSPLVEICTPIAQPQTPVEPPTPSTPHPLATFPLSSSAAQQVVVAPGNNFPELYASTLPSRSVSPKSLEQFFEEYNQEVIARWEEKHAQDPIGLYAEINPKLGLLPKPVYEHLGKCLKAYRKAKHPQVNPKDKHACRLLRLNFLSEEVELFKGYKVSNYFSGINPANNMRENFECFYNVFNFVRPCVFYKIIQQVKLVNIVRNGRYEWPTLDVLKNQFKERIFDYEYDLFKKYFEGRFKEVCKDFQFFERHEQMNKMTDVAILIQQSPLLTFMKPLQETYLRPMLLLPEELCKLTISKASEMSPTELEGLIMRFNAENPPLHRLIEDDQITQANLGEVTLSQLSQLPADKLEQLLPLLPDWCCRFISKVYDLPVDELNTYFDKIFPIGELFFKTKPRLQTLSPIQVNVLLPKFTHFHFSFLTKIQVSNIPIKMIKANFQKLFPRISILSQSTSLYKNLDVDLFTELVKLFDKERLARVPIDVLLGIDRTLYSPQQLADLRLLSVPTF